MASAFSVQSSSKLNSELQCMFCKENQLSQKLLAGHLMLCGNKTEQCPNCRKFIRRAIFAYHYENECADFDEPEDSGQRRTYQSEKSSSTKLNAGYSSHIIECEYCRQQCSRNYYKTHQEHCLQNPDKIRQNQQRTSLLPDRSQFDLTTKESVRPKEITYIPCEFCHQSIDFDDLSAHTENCQKKEKQRIKTLAETISREPIIEHLPCEYCGQSQSHFKLEYHQSNCDQNPLNRNLRSHSSQAQSSTSTQPTYVSTCTIYLKQPNTPDEAREAKKQQALSSHVKANIPSIDNQMYTENSKKQQLPTESDSQPILFNSAHDHYERSRTPRLPTSSHSHTSRSLSQRPSSSASLDRRTVDTKQYLSSTQPGSSINHNSRSHSVARGSRSTDEKVKDAFQRSHGFTFFNPSDNARNHQPVTNRSSRSSRPVLISILPQPKLAKRVSKN